MHYPASCDKYGYFFLDLFTSLFDDDEILAGGGGGGGGAFDDNDIEGDDRGLTRFSIFLTLLPLPSTNLAFIHHIEQ